jgi:hypothetical protein
MFGLAACRSSKKTARISDFSFHGMVQRHLFASTQTERYIFKRRLLEVRQAARMTLTAHLAD